MKIKICDIQRGDILKGIFHDHHIVEVVGEPFFTKEGPYYYWKCPVKHTQESMYNRVLSEVVDYYINADDKVQNDSDFYGYANNVTLHKRNNNFIQKYIPKKVTLK